MRYSSPSLGGQLAGLRILVVESSSLGADLTRSLRRRGDAAEVELLIYSSLARQRLSSPPAPHLVLLDYNLADGTSDDLAVWMLTQPLLQNTVRVSYSGRDPGLIQANVRQCLAKNGQPLGRFSEVFDAYITKPDFRLIDTLNGIVRASTRLWPAALDLSSEHEQL